MIQKDKKNRKDNGGYCLIKGKLVETTEKEKRQLDRELPRKWKMRKMKVTNTIPRQNVEKLESGVLHCG